MKEVRINLEDGSEETLVLPTRRIVCPECGGRGKDIFSNGVPSQYFEEDPDFAEDYRSGMYDAVCGECHGHNVVDEFDYEAMDSETRRKVEWHEEQKARYEHEVLAERRFFERAAEAQARW